MNEPKNGSPGAFLDGDCFTPIRWDGSAMDWRKIIGSPYCDLRSGQKHVLTTMARYGDKWGDNIYPSQREIATRARVSPKCVNQVMKRAEKEGWIIRHFVGGGRGYKRTTYGLAIPAGVADATALLKKKFWDPPYRYTLARQDGKVFLVERPPTCLPSVI